MDTSISCLINSISRFIHLVLCQATVCVHLQPSYRKTTELLKQLKVVLDEVAEQETILQPGNHDVLHKQCEELDVAVNEAREFMESWSPKMSKICSILQCEPLLMRIQKSSLEICQIFCTLLPSASSSSSLARIKELQCLKQLGVVNHIEEALRDQQDGVIPHTDTIMRIIELLNLRPNQELFRESMAVEKERKNAQSTEAPERLYELTNQIVNLVAHIRECLVRTGSVEIRVGVPVPPYFLCPLSLELMLEPVIVASGQTYDRASIKKWLDHGLDICPKTRQLLSHKNLIPNYTVRAMAESWCEQNGVKIPTCAKNQSQDLVFQRSTVGSPQQNGVEIPNFAKNQSQDLVFQQSTVGSPQQNGVEIPNFAKNQSQDLVFQQSTVGSPQQNGVKIPNFAKNRSQDSVFQQSTVGSPQQNGVKIPTFAKNQSQDLVFQQSTVGSPQQNGVKIPTFAKNQSQDLIFQRSTVGSPQSKSSTPRSRSSSGLSLKSSRESEDYDSQLLDLVSTLSRSESASSSMSNAPPLQITSFLNPNVARNQLSGESGSRYDGLTTKDRILKLVEELQSQSDETQGAALAEMRLLAKHNKENRVLIGQTGDIPPLVALLYSKAKETQEHAVTTLLNISISEENKSMIGQSGAIEPLIHVLRSGTEAARENSAATLFSLSNLEDYRARIGRTGAVKALVSLLGSGTLRGKKDAATALFNLSIFHENKSRIVQSGAVKYLVELLDPDSGMVDKSVALLANLSTIGEGRMAIAKAGGIPLLVEVVETGSQRGKENASSVILQLCLNSTKFCTLVLQEGVVPPLVALSQSGTPRAKEKAQQLLSHFRNQREIGIVKGKS